MMSNIRILKALALSTMCIMSTEAFAQDTLRIAVFGGVWRDAIREGVVANFEKATGTTVSIEAANYNEIVAKLRAGAGNPPYDLVPLNPYAIEAMEAAKLIVPIDRSRLPNLVDLSPALLKKMSVGDDLYAVPFSLGQLALAYRTDMIDTPPTSWLDLFDPKYKGCGVAMLAPATSGGGAETMSALAKAAGGADTDPAVMDKVFEAVKAGKDNIVAFPANTADMSTLLQRGEACLGAQYDGRTIELGIAGVPLALAVPKEGSVAAGNGYALTAGSPNVDLAYKFLEFVSDPQSQAIFAGRIYYATSNLKTPYGETFMKYRPVATDFDNLIWLDSNGLSQRVADWQTRWEAIFR